MHLSAISVIVKLVNKTYTKTFAFILGREKELALAELRAVLKRFDFCFDILSIKGNIAFANIESFSKDDAIRAINILGGTTKIFKVLGDVGAELEKQIIDIILENKTTESKLNFGISWYDQINKHAFQFGLLVKKALKSKGLSVRYVESREAEISTILSTKNNLAGEGIEIGILGRQIGILLAVSNPYEWSKRDYDKPKADKRSGMLPPKLARMMVNLALSQSKEYKIKDLELKKISTSIGNCSDCIVIDPFCGSGNILMEAMMLECDVFGSDISEKAVKDTIANLDWLMQTSKCKMQNAKIVLADATKDNLISLMKNSKFKVENYDCNAIVCEPYLGEPKKFKPSLNAAKGEYNKVKDIYIGFLKNIASLYSSNEASSRPRTSNDIILCIVFPLVETVEGKRHSLFLESVDEIKKLGYTQIRSFIYGRDYQVVKREIVLLKI